MNKINASISRSVKTALNKNQLNLHQICEAFNAHYKEDINAQKIRPLNKDFVSRVARNDFKIPSPRVLKLCEFLDIEVSDFVEDQLQVLSNQIREFELHAQQNSDFGNRYSDLRRFLSGLNLDQMFSIR